MQKKKVEQRGRAIRGTLKEAVESIPASLKLPIIKFQKFTFLSPSHIALFYSFKHCQIFALAAIEFKQSMMVGQGGDGWMTGDIHT